MSLSQNAKERLVIALADQSAGDEIENALNQPGGGVTQEDLDNAIEAHEEASDPHPQYLQDLPVVWSSGIWIARSSSGGSDTTGTGSFNKPFASLSRALTFINSQPNDPVNNPTIFFKPGEYTIGNLTLDGTASINLAAGLTIIGCGNSDSQPVKLLGGFVLQGNITRFRVKDLQISPLISGDYALDINGTQGRHYFDNVTFSGGQGINFRGSYQRWTEFVNCTCSTQAVLGDGSCLASASVRFRGFSDWGCTVTVNDVNMRLEMLDTYRVGRIVHNAGKAFISRLDEIRSSNANAIESTASGVNDRLLVVNVNLRRWDTYAYGLINKTGSCPYEIFNVNRDGGSDTLTGSPL